MTKRWNAGRALLRYIARWREESPRYSAMKRREEVLREEGPREVIVGEEVPREVIVGEEVPREEGSLEDALKYREDVRRAIAIDRDRKNNKAIRDIEAAVKRLKQGMKNEPEIHRIRDAADVMLRRLQDERRGVHWVRPLPADDGQSLVDAKAKR